MHAPMPAPRILFLDAYDSFSNNITSLLATTLHADVHILPIDAELTGDAERHALHRLLQSYDAVVCGPGPGSPDRAADTGLMRHVWGGAPDAPGAPGAPGAPTEVTPALGICLGFQSFVVAHGGRIRRLRSGGLHGMVRRVVTRTDDDDDDDGLFAGVPAFQATLYHSLGADVGQDAIAAADWPLARWQPCGDLQPLAWLDDTGSHDTDSLESPAPEHLLMAVRHRRLPFWGLQYHPESVCTDAAASRAVLANWFRAAQRWNTAHGRVRLEVPARMAARQATRPSLLSSLVELHDVTTTPSAGVVCRTIPLPAGLQVPDLVEALTSCADDDDEHIILDSSAAAAQTQPDPETDSDPDEDRAIRGRFSIVALCVDQALRVEHRAGEAFATIKRPGSGSTQNVPLRDGQTIWHLLAAVHAARRLAPPSWSQDRPFVGGFMGYVAYEQGLHDIGGGVDTETSNRPSLCFAWVQHSLVVDHVRGLVHVQHLYGGSQGEAKEAEEAVNTAVARLQAARPGSSAAPPPAAHIHIHRPDLAAYEAKVRACQEHIAAGDAYELCLTDEATVTVTTTGASSSASAWHYYRALRTRNPAPFASYVRLGAATLVSSSPERFLWFGHRSLGSSSTASTPPSPTPPSPTPPSPTPPSSTSTPPLLCSMRPMKGTVRRSPAVATTAQAAALLRVPKEEAENLMIVDLVRHDLHGVCGPGAVSVPRLLQVEPYGHVFQMVSVVGGVLPASRTAGAGPTGLDVLAASLPPGSMTGAPKKRSCALLASLENRPRSLYAGVVGYWCATGQGDWSVTIRSLFRWDDETTTTTTTATTTTTDTTTRTDTWHVGAGGAVTILSTPEGERDEMLAKLGGPLRVFEG